MPADGNWPVEDGKRPVEDGKSPVEDGKSPAASCGTRLTERNGRKSFNYMGQTTDIGRRIELVPLDPHFGDVSIGLYRQQDDGEPAYRVHTYSRLPGAEDRIASVVTAMEVLGGMVRDPDGRLRFPCGWDHNLAVKRVFLEACKLDPSGPVEPRPLEILDKKSGLQIKVLSEGDGVYRVTAHGEGKDPERRISFIAGGLMKLAEIDEVSGTLDRVVFPCGYAHDELIGLLLVRAPNVRAVLREQEMAASRGVLAAPSQQDR